MDLMWVTRSIPIHFPLTTKKWILIFKSRLQGRDHTKKHLSVIKRYIHLFIRIDRLFCFGN